jgi:NADH:ubiquinone oxidoreductase 24 kD subunit
MYRNVIKYKEIDHKIAELAEQKNHNPKALLEIFQSLQEERGELSNEDIYDVAKALGIPGHLAYGVASFYSMLVSPPDTIRTCDGPACWLKGAKYVRAALEKELDKSQRDDKHNRFIERTSCLGLCDRAPAALFGNVQSGQLYPSI